MLWFNFPIQIPTTIDEELIEMLNTRSPISIVQFLYEFWKILYSDPFNDE